MAAIMATASVHGETLGEPRQARKPIDVWLGPCCVRRFSKKMWPRMSRTAWRLRPRGRCGHRGRTTPRRPSMTIQRMDHVGVVVDDLAAATAFFVELGMELEGEAAVEGRWVDRVVGLDGVRVDVAMVRTPDGHGRVRYRGSG
jgi:hypothetical protein